MLFYSSSSLIKQTRILTHFTKTLSSYLLARFSGSSILNPFYVQLWYRIPSISSLLKNIQSFCISYFIKVQFFPIFYILHKLLLHFSPTLFFITLQYFVSVRTSHPLMQQIFSYQVICQALFKILEILQHSCIIFLGGWVVEWVAIQQTRRDDNQMRL